MTGQLAELEQALVRYEFKFTTMSLNTKSKLMQFVHNFDHIILMQNRLAFSLQIFRYTVDFLVDEHDFKLVSVPDLLHPNILRGCGMDVDGERTQVCSIHLSCLSFFRFYR